MRRYFRDFREIDVVPRTFIRALLFAGAGTVVFSVQASAQSASASSPPAELTIGDVLKAALNQHPLIEAARAGGRAPAQRTTLYDIVGTY